MTPPKSGDLAGMRKEYGRGGDGEADGSPDLDAGWLGSQGAAGWSTLLLAWIDEARRAGAAEPNAMVLATVDRSVDPAGRPAARTVLCKAVEPDGVVFYTHRTSAKGRQLTATPYASATFCFLDLGRQVHVRGPVTPTSAQETADYFARRPRGSQLGAWASHQSRPIASRAALETQLEEVTARFAGTADIPPPDGWGGYRLAAEVVEFWQGRASRVHNRIVAHPGDGHVERLQP